MHNRLGMIELFNNVHKCQQAFNVSLMVGDWNFFFQSKERLAKQVANTISCLNQLPDINTLLDEDCNSPLHFAVKSGNITILNYILAHEEVQCNIRNAKNETPLQIASMMAGNELYLPIILRLLDRSDIDIKIKNSSNLTALDFVALCSDELAIKAMLAHPSMTIDFYFETVRKLIQAENAKMSKFMIGEMRNNIHVLNSKENIKQLAKLAAGMGYINIVKTFFVINPDAVSDDKFLYTLINHKNRKKIQDIATDLNVRKGYCIPILEKQHAKLYFSAKYEKNKHRKRIAILEQDVEFSNSNELGKFLIRLKGIIDQNKDFRTRMQFIITSKHWISGDIKIENGKMSVLFIDPLGATFRDGWLDSTLINAIAMFHDSFPSATLYASVEALQRKDFTSCTLFSMDNASHLYNEDYYLRKGPIKGDLHDYLEAHFLGKASIQTESGQEVNYNLVSLPLRMIRCMQSLSSNPVTGNKADFFAKRGIFGRVTDNPDGNGFSPVNKRGETVMRSVSPYLDEKTGKEINARLFHKLNCNRKAIMDYMGSVSKERVEHNMKKFGLDGILKTLSHDSEHQLKNKFSVKPIRSSKE